MRKSSVVLAVALLASVASAAWMWTELRAERVRSARLAAELDRAPQVSDGAAEHAAPGAAVPAVPVVAEKSSTTSQSQAPETNGRREDWEAHQRALMRDPKFREALREQKRLAYAPRRANLIRLLGLSPEQADAAIDLQLDQEVRLNEAFQVETPTDESRLERRARLDALEQAHQDKLRQLLGEDKRAKLQAYMETRQSRMQVDRFRSELTEANALRDDQVEPLIAALHAERDQMQRDLQEYSDTLGWEGAQNDSWRRYSERQAELLKSMHGRMHSSASSVLTSAQLDALDSMLGREYARFEAQQRVNRIQSKLDRPATPATSSN